jgi:hypothetical protein
MSLSASMRNAAVAASLLAASFMSFSVVTPALSAKAAAKPEITAEAGAALRQMSQTLLGKQFSFKARTLRVYADADGKFLHIEHNLKVLVRRPDGLRVDTDGDDGSGQFLYDGKAVVLYGAAKNEYVRLPAPNTIGAMVEEVVFRTGVDFPLANFLTDAPGDAILSGVTMGKVVNTVTIDGVPCLHLILFQPPGVELELWLEKNDRSLPRRLFLTYRSVPGQPNFIAEFSDWNISATPTDADFAFTAPAGAKQVEPAAMVGPTAPANAAPAKAKGAKK